LEQLSNINNFQAKELADFLVKHWERFKIQEQEIKRSKSQLEKLISFLEKEIRHTEREQHLAERSRSFLKWIHKSKEGDLSRAQLNQKSRSQRLEQLPLLRELLNRLKSIQGSTEDQLQVHLSRQVKLKEFSAKLIPHLKRFQVTVPHLHHLISA
jgi:hypothetical protein